MLDELAPHLPPLVGLGCLQANSVAQQALGNIRTVYAFNGEQRTVESYSSTLDHPMKVGPAVGVGVVREPEAAER